MNYATKAQRLIAQSKPIPIPRLDFDGSEDILLQVNDQLSIGSVEELIQYLEEQLPEGGGGTGPSEPEELKPKYGITLIGDSIGQGGAVTKTSLLERICMFSEQKWVYRRIFAIGGKTSAQIRTEQLTQVFDMDPLPKACIVECGYNDLNDPDAALIQIEAMYVELIEAGIVPVCTLIHPRTETPSSVGNAYKLNNGVSALKEKYGLPIMDMAGILWAPQGYAFKDPTLTNDGTHLTIRAYSQIAKAILADKRFTENVPSDGGIQLLYSNEDHYNWAVNGLFMLNGADNGAAYWNKSNGGADQSMITAVRGRALKVTANGSGIAYGGSTLDIDVSYFQRFEFTAIIESEWGATAEAAINAIPTGSTSAEQNAAANAKDAAIPFVDLVNIYFTSADYTQNYGTQYALGKPGTRHERSTLKVQMDVPAGAKRAIIIFGSMNNNAVASETWASIESLFVKKIY
jgi:lysophospholipase L1-like esterase